MSAITRIQYDVSLEILEFVENTHLQIQYTVSLGTSHLKFSSKKTWHNCFGSIFRMLFQQVSHVFIGWQRLRRNLVDATFATNSSQICDQFVASGRPNSISTQLHAGNRPQLPPKQYDCHISEKISGKFPAKVCSHFQCFAMNSSQRLRQKYFVTTFVSL